MIYQKLPDSFPGTGYGMTETNATGSSSTGAAYAYKPKSTGTKAPIVEVRIVDENGNELPQGQRGEIQLKSPTVVQGYWNKPEASKETFHNGWLATGDVGYLDEEGFLFITDRIKDMVIRGGENIYSVEIESTILHLEGVQEVAAFGIPEEKLGEELAVAVVLKPGITLTAADIQAHVAANLARFKVPSYVFFEDSLPKNATLKIMKKPLKEKYAKKP
jgi:acyl-CoA synthetase (AMP-forming)/AMP-acid ligase II